MPDGVTDYLARCLAGVPESKYRTRLALELEGHLADLAESFLARGFAREEADRLAREKLGDPELLREEYAAAWLRQPECRRRDLGRLLLCLLLAPAGQWAASLFLEWFGSADAFPIRRSLGWSGSPAWSLFARSFLFSARALPCLVWLLWRFRRSPSRRGWVTAGLMLAWGLDMALLLLDAGMRGLPSPLYVLGTLGASLMIGLVFG